MTAVYRLTNAAQADLDAIQDYLLERSPQASLIVGDALAAAFAALAEFPNKGHYRTDLTNRPVRF
jgi:plasmid stabilization system protein ParE